MSQGGEKQLSVVISGSDLVCKIEDKVCVCVFSNWARKTGVQSVACTSQFQGMWIDVSLLREDCEILTDFFRVFRMSVAVFTSCKWVF